MMKLTKRRHFVGWLAAAIIAGAAGSLRVPTIAPELGAATTGQHWAGTWATALVARPQTPPPPPPQAARPPAPLLNFKDQTLRQIVRVSIGGDRFRIVLSNAFGTAPLAVGAAHVGLRQKDSAIVPQSNRALTFSGNPSGTIPPGAVLFSDSVNLTVPALADLAIDIYLPGDTAASNSPLATHGGTGALQTNYISSPGNHAGAAEFPVASTTLAWFFVSRVEVMAPDQVGTIVTVGDSITDGSRSTPDTNSRWPSQFAKRLVQSKVRMSVVNVGISGNRLLSDGGAGANVLARMDRDVLVQSGATHVIVLIGINDIGGGRPRATAADLIAGHKQIIERARAQGLRIYGATVTPFEATTIANYWSTEGETARQGLNQWIRTSGAYDGVIDFDAVVRDPANPAKVMAQYDSGDHLHPNDAGYGLMANAIDLGLFKMGKGR